MFTIKNEQSGKYLAPHGTNRMWTDQIEEARIIKSSKIAEDLMAVIRQGIPEVPIMLQRVQLMEIHKAEVIVLR